jgi:hypothetical protein
MPRQRKHPEGTTTAQKAAIGNLESGSGDNWIPVKEGLPRTNTGIIVFHEGEVKTAWFDVYQNAIGDNYREESENSPIYHGFTHWMPQPDDPEGNNK